MRYGKIAKTGMNMELACAIHLNGGEDPEDPTDNCTRSWDSSSNDGSSSSNDGSSSSNDGSSSRIQIMVVLVDIK